MNDIFADAARVFDAMCGGLIQRRRLVADYKDDTGRDLHQEIMTLHDPNATDEALVESIREELAQAGCKLTGLAEEGTGRVLYLAPGYLEEFAAEMGLTMPENIAAALTAVGVHPVNWEELTHGK